MDVDWLAKEYPYPPAPTTHGMSDPDADFDPDDEVGGFGAFE
jgi:hypothetical protein